MPKVLSLHQVELRPGVDEHEFQRVVFDELAPFYCTLEWEIRLFKGDRGARDGKYLLIFEIPSPAARDRLVPTPGKLSDEGRKIFATAGPVWEKIKTFTTTFLDPEFTDYVMVDEEIGEGITPPKEKIMTTQQIEAFVRRGFDAYNAHQSDPHWLDYTTTDVAAECEVVDMPSGLVLHGPEGLKQFLLLFSTAFPDSRGDIHIVCATEEQAVIEVILRGTHTGVLHSPAGDIPPSGRTIELHACEVFQIRNRKITRHTTYYDALSLMQQLGVMPAA